MDIVFLDKGSLGEDIDQKDIPYFNRMSIFDKTLDEEIVSRCEHAKIIITNKVNLHKDVLKSLTKLEKIIITATGVNNVDTDYCLKNNIEVSNSIGYASESVAYNVFASFFHLNQNLNQYKRYTEDLQWSSHDSFSYFNTFNDLSSQTWGVVGLGKIGRQVARIAKSFGANIIYFSTSGQNNTDEFTSVSFEELLKEADIISVHCALTKATENLFNESSFNKMQAHTFMNFSRGEVIDEESLSEILESNSELKIALDVSTYEPFIEKSPLKRYLKDSRFLMTPHMSWASVESRSKLLEHIGQNLKDFFSKNG